MPCPSHPPWLYQYDILIFIIPHFRESN
jgi:hypothetical protein